jgi:ADP-L-glycero-D-manno-heptose 6-epimerase
VEAKRKNWEGKTYHKIIERQAFLAQLANDEHEIDIIIHLGARTDTTEFNYAIHAELNVEYSKAMWSYATKKNIPLIYASSAATYGAGEHGYEDSHTILDQLKPLNPYGVSKNEFDKWALAQTLIGKANSPSAWTGLKFFNVYGPNEGHKARMASVIFHSFNQIAATGLVKLFKSHRPDFKDGAQLRDFIYVKDLVNVIFWMMQQMLSGTWSASHNGLYNLGTGKARTFYDLAANTFTAQGLQPNIEFIDMPLDIRDKYQYFTEANMNKLRAAGYDKPFSSLEEGVADYVKNYLLPGKGY